MSYTKRDIVKQAFDISGLASLSNDLDGQHYDTARISLDMMISSWRQQGVRIGYPISSTLNGSDLDQDTNVADSDLEAIVYNLALRLMNKYGKIITPDTRQIATRSLQLLTTSMVLPPINKNKAISYGSGRYRSTVNIDTLTDNTTNSSQIELSDDDFLEL